MRRWWSAPMRCGGRFLVARRLTARSAAADSAPASRRYRASAPGSAPARPLRARQAPRPRTRSAPARPAIGSDMQRGRISLREAAAKLRTSTPRRVAMRGGMTTPAAAEPGNVDRLLSSEASRVSRSRQVSTAALASLDVFEKGDFAVKRRQRPVSNSSVRYSSRCSARTHQRATMSRPRARSVRCVIKKPARRRTDADATNRISLEVTAIFCGKR